MRSVFRAPAIRSDLVRLLGRDWAARHPVRPAARHYADRIRAGRDAPARLLANAYVRYLGDLSGGRVLDRLMSRAPEIGERGLDFHRFADIADLGEFRRSFRDAIDRAGEALGSAGRAQACAEAVEAFRANIAISADIAARSAAA
jgi:heme oxygenase